MASPCVFQRQGQKSFFSAMDKMKKTPFRGAIFLCNLFLYKYKVNYKVSFMSGISPYTTNLLVSNGILSTADFAGTLPQFDNVGYMPQQTPSMGIPRYDEFVKPKKEGWNWKTWALIAVAGIIGIKGVSMLRDGAITSKINPVNWCKAGWEQCCKFGNWCKKLFSK